MLNFKPTNSLLSERLSIECWETKSKVNTAANRKKGKCNNEPIRAQSKTKLPKGRENAGEQVVAGGLKRGKTQASK